MAEVDLSHRAAVSEDVAFLMRLRASTMDDHLAVSGLELSTEENLQRVMYKFECAEIVLDGTRPIGLLKIDRSGHRWEIIQVQVCPTMQGRGIGTRLLLELIDEARAANASLTLSVLRSNPAKGLYESLGFAVIGEDSTQYFMQCMS